MKKIITYLFLVGLVSLAACNNGACIKGSGNQITQNRNVEPFTAVETGGSMKLILKQDTVQKVSVTADDNIQQLIKTRVSGDKLKIGMDGNFCNPGPVTVYIQTRNLNGVSASGAVEVVSDGRMNTGDFNLDLSGNSKVNLDISAADFKTHSSGSSKITLKGQARSHEMDLSGAGEIQAFDFVVGDYKIETSGSVKCRINVLNNLDVNSSGASEIEYKGNPKQVNNHNSGSSSIKKVQ